MIIKDFQLTEAKNSDHRHSSPQMAMAMAATGEDDGVTAIKTLEGMDVSIVWWNMFYSARKEGVYDMQKNRYKGKQA